MEAGDVEALEGIDRDAAIRQAREVGQDGREGPGLGFGHDVLEGDRPDVEGGFVLDIPDDEIVIIRLARRLEEDVDEGFVPGSRDEAVEGDLRDAEMLEVADAEVVRVDFGSRVARLELDGRDEDVIDVGVRDGVEDGVQEDVVRFHVRDIRDGDALDFLVGGRPGDGFDNVIEVDVHVGLTVLEIDHVDDFDLIRVEGIEGVDREVLFRDAGRRGKDAIEFLVLGALGHDRGKGDVAGIQRGKAADREFLIARDPGRGDEDVIDALAVLVVAEDRLELDRVDVKMREVADVDRVRGDAWVATGGNEDVVKVLVAFVRPEDDVQANRVDVEIAAKHPDREFLGVSPAVAGRVQEDVIEGFVALDREEVLEVEIVHELVRGDPADFADRHVLEDDVDEAAFLDFGEKADEVADFLLGKARGEHRHEVEDVHVLERRVIEGFAHRFGKENPVFVEGFRVFAFAHRVIVEGGDESFRRGVEAFLLLGRKRRPFVHDVQLGKVPEGFHGTDVIEGRGHGDGIHQGLADVREVGEGDFVEFVPVDREIFVEAVVVDGLLERLFHERELAHLDVLVTREEGEEALALQFGIEQILVVTEINAGRNCKSGDGHPAHGYNESGHESAQPPKEIFQGFHGIYLLEGILFIILHSVSLTILFPFSHLI